MNNSALGHARLYLSLRLSLLPLYVPVIQRRGPGCSCGKAKCSSAGKHPVARLVPNGLKNASRDPSIVERWFSDDRINIGIATGAVSGIVVLDIDPRHGGDETLSELERVHGALPHTWRFLTGGGGEHILFRHPGAKVANSAGSLGGGIDVRGDGGYIVAPPSMHSCGRPYAISVDHHPDEAPLADLPSWLRERLVTRTHRGIAVPPRRDWRQHVADTHGEGRRNDAVARLAGHLLRASVDPHVCLTLLASWNEVHCRPPLDRYEVATTVRNIAAREIARREQRRAG